MFHVMQFRNHETRKSAVTALWIAVLLAVLLVVACCGQYELRNNREEGPENGILTGPGGEWIILGPKSQQTGEGEKNNGSKESEANREETKRPENPANGD
jgi:hypothetical protein